MNSLIHFFDREPGGCKRRFLVLPLPFVVLLSSPLVVLLVVITASLGMDSDNRTGTWLWSGTGAVDECGDNGEDQLLVGIGVVAFFPFFVFGDPGVIVLPWVLLGFKHIQHVIGLIFRIGTVPSHVLQHE